MPMLMTERSGRPGRALARPCANARGELGHALARLVHLDRHVDAVDDEPVKTAALAEQDAGPDGARTG